jgi:hypothetical protein
VPRYQRKYVWTLRNWAVLWNDILAAMAPQPDGTADMRHFLGAVVLRSRSVGGSTNMVESEVIDGQQRLATLLVLLVAVREVATARGVDARQLATLRKLIYNDEETALADERFKLRPTRLDWEAFRAAMAEKAGPEVEEARQELEYLRKPGSRRRRRDPVNPLSTHPLVLARAHFTEAIEKWLAPGHADDRVEQLLTLVNHGLGLMVIDLEPDDNPQHIFESINVKAVPLEAADLVRNYIFQVMQSRGFNEDDLYEEHWSRFEDGFWRQTVNEGPRARTHLENFLVFFLVMELRKRVNRKELYLTFKEYAKPQETDLPGLLARFARYAGHYRSLVQRTGLDPYEARFTARLAVLATDALMPLILHIFGTQSGPVRRSMLEQVEAFSSGGRWSRARHAITTPSPTPSCAT